MTPMTKRRTFSPELKADIVRLVRHGKRSVASVCEENKIHSSRVYEWLRKSDEAQTPAGKLEAAERDELTRLRAELREVARERDFLKQAAAYFARTKA